MNTLFDTQTAHQYIPTGYAMDHFATFDILEMVMTVTNLEQMATSIQNFIIESASKRQYYDIINYHKQKAKSKHDVMLAEILQSDDDTIIYKNQQDGGRKGRPIVQADCNRGLIQCSDAGGSKGDDSATIRADFEGLDYAANLVGAGTFGTVLVAAVLASLTAVAGLLSLLLALGGVGLGRTLYNAFFITG